MNQQFSGKYFTRNDKIAVIEKFEHPRYYGYVIEKPINRPCQWNDDGNAVVPRDSNFDLVSRITGTIKDEGY